ncbi:MAG TPA: hypothetical protein DIW07_08340 [Lachnospiraceae bacterium]|uniref:hypothetical protein n=1 Tax=Muricomes intestini TaxID=1796634 RepID=UPI000EE24282|nr:hypothetical protein [Muricomes intestini]HCR83408.1 hypothetical protein [Lachnospiraceae bacterium]
MNEWMNNPAMKNLDPVKLQLIQMAASQTAGKSGRDLAPVLLALISNANKKGVRFSEDEISLILEVLKEGKPKEEQAQIDQTINMVRSLLKKKA